MWMKDKPWRDCGCLKKEHTEKWICMWGNLSKMWYVITVWFKEKWIEKLNQYLKFSVIAFDTSMRSLVNKDLEHFLNWKYGMKF